MHVFLIILAFIALFGVGGFFAARARAYALTETNRKRIASRPVHHASFVAIATTIPALLLLTIWMVASPLMIGAEIRQGLS